MAIRLSNKYPGQYDNSDPTGYPHGKARNDLTPDDGTGTPWEQDVANDIQGLLQSLLALLEITPSDTPDKVGASQYLEALERRYRQPTAWWRGSLAPTTTTNPDPLELVDGGAGKSYTPIGEWALEEGNTGLIVPFPGVWGVSIRAQFTTASNITLQLNRGAARAARLVGVTNGSLAVAHSAMLPLDINNPVLWTLRIHPIASTVTPASESVANDAHDITVTYLGPLDPDDE